MRGCDWRRMAVRSETVSSASPSSARMRSRVASAAALSAPWSASNGRWAGVSIGVGRSPISLAGDDVGLVYKDIFIRLSGNCKTEWAASHPPSLPELRRPAILMATPGIDPRGHPHERQRLRYPRWRNRDRTAGKVRCLALFHWPHPHALDPARGMPE